MNKLYKTPVVSAIVLLLLPVVMTMIDPYDSLPEGYFTLLRIIVCGVAIYLAVIAHNIKKLNWMWTIGFIAILFNPVIQIHLEEELWLFIDFVVSITLLLGIFVLSGEGATKSVFKTKAFKNFQEVLKYVFLGTLAMGFLAIIISSVEYYLKKKATKLPQGFVLEERRQPVNLLEHFDIKTARPVDGSFIETYNKGEIIIIGNHRDGRESGLWKIFDKYGNLRAEKEYDKGILNNTVIFDENGELRSRHPYSEGKIVGGIRLSDIIYVSDYDVVTREAVSFVNMDYQDKNIKAKLLTPYVLTLAIKKYLFSEEYDYRKYLCFEIDIEVINKTKIIKNVQGGGRGYLKDNYGNSITTTARIGSADLRFGDKKKITFESLEMPLKNAIYFNFEIPKNSMGNLNDMNFTFPAFFIEERNNENIENK